MTRLTEVEQMLYNPDVCFLHSLKNIQGESLLA